MDKRRNKAAVERTRSTPVGLPRRRDPLTRVAFYCQLMAMGLVAASLLLRFPNDLQRGNAPAISLDNFPDWPQKLAVIAVHTRLVCVVLALFGAVVAVIAYRARYTLRKKRLVTFAPLVVLLVMAVQAGAQGYLQSQGALKIEVRSTGPVGVVDGVAATRVGAPALNNATETITRMTISEGTVEEWKLLFWGDFLFGTPIFFAWLLRFWPEKKDVSPAVA